MAPADPIPIRNHAKGAGLLETRKRSKLANSLVTNDKLIDIAQSKHNYGPYCEQLLLDILGASKVESFDNSDYENATYVADLNLPLDKFGEYDTVFDGGILSRERLC